MQALGEGWVGGWGGAWHQERCLSLGQVLGSRQGAWQLPGKVLGSRRGVLYLREKER